MRSFAIGLNGWVELRKCKGVPKRIETKEVVKSSRRKYKYFSSDEWPFFIYKWVMVPTTTVIRIVTFKGGRRYGVMKSRQFAALVGISIREGRMIELRQETYDMIKKRMKAAKE